MAEILPEFPKLVRGRLELTGQFFYRWGLADTKTIGSFLAMFRQSFAIAGFVSVDMSVFPPDNGVWTARPRLRLVWERRVSVCVCGEPDSPLLGWRALGVSLRGAVWYTRCLDGNILAKEAGKSHPAA